jgi:uncharacterized membrane protein YccC
MLGLVLDGSIAILILAALALGLRLQRNLRELRSSDGELERLIVALDGASERSAAAVDGLRQAATDADQRLAGAQGLVDDLRFLTSRGEQLADRLEDQIRRGRPAAQRSEPPPPKPAAPKPPARSGRSGPTADLERTLRALR